MESTSDWLRELGAVRPMSPAGHEVLVLGAWNEQFYPIEWCRYYDRVTRDINGKLMNPGSIEQWRVFGFLTHEKLTRSDCERILRSVNCPKISDSEMRNKLQFAAEFVWEIYAKFAEDKAKEALENINSVIKALKA